VPTTSPTPHWPCGTLTPDANRPRIALTVDRGWRPRDLKPSLRVLTRLTPVFRRWPTTYRWEGTLGHHGACLDGGGPAD